MIQLLL